MSTQNRELTTSINSKRGTIHFWSITWYHSHTIIGFLWDGKTLAYHRTEEILTWRNDNTEIRTVGGVYKLATSEESAKALERGLRL